MTNGDKIRQLSDEELARVIGYAIYGCNSCAAVFACYGNDPITGIAKNCVRVWEDWLKQEAKDE